MSCCCESTHPLLGALMGGLLAKGSLVRVGFAYNYAWNPQGVDAEQLGIEWIRLTLTNDLIEFGVFDSVTVTVKPTAYQNFQDGYITVQGITSTQHSDPENIGSIVQNEIQTYLPGISIQDRDAVQIDSVPQTARGKSGVTQVTPPTGQNQPGQPPPSGKCPAGYYDAGWLWTDCKPLPASGVPPGECSLNTQDFGDWVACQLGIKSTVGGMAAGAAGAMVGVGILTLLAVVLLKR